jgi:chromosomal replication initiation ATPase DnaA
MSIQSLDQRLADLRRLRAAVDVEVVRCITAADRAFYTEAARLAAAVFQISPVEIFTLDRHAEIRDARAVVYFVGRLLGESYPRIGHALGRDHTTVLSGCRKVAADPRLRAIADDIAGQLGRAVAS